MDGSTLVVICAAFLAILVDPALTLTAEEIALFKTTGMTEMNTGVVGTVSVTINTNTLTIISSTGVPDHLTGRFPSRYNPNFVRVQSHSFDIPRNPENASSPSCLPMGPIAMATNGVPIFSLLTAEGTDATETEVFDSCNGHPARTGAYHYHQDPACLDSILGNPAGLVGVALDGFAIYGRVGEDGVELTSADLDECHGHAPNGETYHYHITADYPYTLGCYKGTRIAPSRGDCLFFTATASPTQTTTTDPPTLPDTTLPQTTTPDPPTLPDTTSPPTTTTAPPTLPDTTLPPTTTTDPPTLPDTTLPPITRRPRPRPRPRHLRLGPPRGG